MVLISLGYLTLPFDIKRSVKTLVSNDYVLYNTASTLSIQGFVQSLPVMNPTIERHIIQLSSKANATEKEICQTLHQAFCRYQRHAYAVIPLADAKMCILSATEQHDLFTLHIIEYQNEPSAVSTHEKIPDLENSVKPAEMLKACQSWPQSKSQLTEIANQIYNMALIYGYWGNWQVFQGICQRYKINPQQFIGS